MFSGKTRSGRQGWLTLCLAIKPFPFRECSFRVQCRTNPCSSLLSTSVTPVCVRPTLSPLARRKISQIVGDNLFHMSNHTNFTDGDLAVKHGYFEIGDMAPSGPTPRKWALLNDMFRWEESLLELIIAFPQSVSRHLPKRLSYAQPFSCPCPYCRLTKDSIANQS